MLKKLIGAILVAATLLSSTAVFAAPSKETKVIEREFYRQDIQMCTEKFFEYDGEYYLSLSRFRNINGFNVTNDEYGNMLFVFVSRAKHKWFDYYFDYDEWVYEDRAKVDGMEINAVLPIKLEKKDYPDLASMFSKDTEWFIPVSYIVRETGGTFSVNGKTAVIDYGFKPSIDPREKGRH